MTTYATRGPDFKGQYFVCYPTPGVPNVLTTAGACPSKALADEACARLNETQVADRRAALARKASLLILGGEH